MVYGRSLLLWIFVISFVSGRIAWCLTGTHTHAWIHKDKAKETHNDTQSHTSRQWQLLYLLQYEDLYVHTTKTMCAALYKQTVKSRSWPNPCSMLFLRGEWGVRWIRHKGSSSSCHRCPCSGRTETNLHPHANLHLVMYRESNPLFKLILALQVLMQRKIHLRYLQGNSTVLHVKEMEIFKTCVREFLSQCHCRNEDWLRTLITLMPLWPPFS